MASNPGDTVLDPFGGSGTTYAVAEIKGRKWLGCELGPVDDILARFEALDEDQTNLERLRQGLNCLFTGKTQAAREARGLWTAESVQSIETCPEPVQRSGDLFTVVE